MGCINYEKVADAQHFPGFDVRNCLNICFSHCLSIQSIIPFIRFHQQSNDEGKKSIRKKEKGAERKVFHASSKQAEYYSYLGSKLSKPFT